MKYKHNPNKVLEACAETLKNEMGFNPKQVLRYFKVFPLDDIDPLFKSLDDPSARSEDWYHLKDSQSHDLLFNFETREYLLLYPDEFWKDSKIAFYKKTEAEIDQKKELYKQKIKEIKKSLVGKRIIPAIEWYFSSPILSIIEAPIDYIKNLLKNSIQYFEIENENLDDLTHWLFEAYYDEERKAKEKD